MAEPRFAPPRPTETPAPRFAGATEFQAVPGAFDQLYGPPSPKPAAPKPKLNLDPKEFFETKPLLPRFMKRVENFKEKAADKIVQYQQEHPEDADLLKPAPLSAWAKSIGESIAKAGLRATKLGVNLFSPTGPAAMVQQRFFPDSALKIPSPGDAVDFIAAKAGIPLKEATQVKQDRGNILSQLHKAFVEPVKNGFEIAKMPAGKEKEDALDAWAFKTADSFVSALTIGVTDEAMKENAISFEGGELFYKGIPVGELSETELKGTSAGGLSGQFAGSMVTYGLISPMLTQGLRTVPALDAAFKAHPYASSVILTNAAEEGFEATVRKGTGQSYTFLDTIVGMFSGAVFETGKLGLGGFKVDPELRASMDADARADLDVEAVRAFIDGEVKAYTLENGHVPDVNDLRAQIGSKVIPGTEMTVEMLHKQLATSGFKEARLAELKGGKEGRPGIEYGAEPPKPESDARIIADLTEAQAKYVPGAGSKEQLKFNNALKKDPNAPAVIASSKGEWLQEPPKGKVATRYVHFDELYDIVKSKGLVPEHHALAATPNTLGFDISPDEAAVRGAGLFNPKRGPIWKIQTAIENVKNPSEIMLTNGAGIETKVPISIDQLHITGPGFDGAPAARFSAEGEGKVRRFAETIQDAPAVDPNVKKAVATSPDRFYEPVANPKRLKKMQEKIDADESAVVARIMGKEKGDADMYAAGAELLRRPTNGNKARAEQQADIAVAVMKKSTDTAQALQSLAMMSRITKEGALVYATRQMQNADEFRGIPEGKRRKLTPDQIDKIDEFTNRIQKMPDGEGKIKETARMLLYMEEMNRASFGEMASGFQTIMMLLNTKSPIRNLIGNTAMVPAEGGAKLFAQPADLAMSVFTGKRSVGVPALMKGKAPGFYPFAKGFIQGVTEAYEGINTRNISSRYFTEGANTRRSRTFRRFGDDVKGKDIPGRAVEAVVRKLEDTTYAILQGPDRAFYERGFITSLENQMRVRGMDFEKAQLEGFKNVPKDILEEAQLDANRAIFEEPSALRTASVGLKRVLNLGKPFGIGDVIWKFAGIPATLLKRGLEYSVAGYPKFLIEVSKGILGKEWNQKQAAEAFGRATMGTVGLAAIGYKMAEQGMIVGSPNDDRDLEALNRKLGMGRYSINMSALKRYALSLDDKKARGQEGDMVVNYDWFQPFSMEMAMGANTFFNRKSPGSEKLAGLGTSALGAIQGGIDSYEGLSMVQGLKSFLYGDDTWTSRFAKATSELPSSFVPTLFNQMRQFVDNISRETYDPDPFVEALNRVKSRVPGLSQGLPPRRDPTSGKPLEIYTDGSNNLFNVFFNPAFMTKVVEDKQLQEILGLYRTTGELKQVPRVVPRTVTIDGEKRELTGKEVSEYQKFVAEETRRYYDVIMASPEYGKLPDPIRVDILTRILTGVNAAAKIELFDADPSKQSRLGQSMVIMRRNRQEDPVKDEENFEQQVESEGFRSMIAP